MFCYSIQFDEHLINSIPSDITGNESGVDGEFQQFFLHPSAFNAARQMRPNFTVQFVQSHYKISLECRIKLEKNLNSLRTRLYVIKKYFPGLKTPLEFNVIT